MADKKKEEKAERGIFNALSDLEGLATELSDVIQLLNVYEEVTDKDLGPIEKGGTWGDRYFVQRRPIHRATLNVIRIRLLEIVEEMESSVYESYDLLRASKASQSQ